MVTQTADVKDEISFQMMAIRCICGLKETPIEGVWHARPVWVKKV